MTPTSDSESPKFPSMQSAEVLLALDEEQLLAQLGALQLGETLGVRPSDFGRYIRVGRLWLDSNLDDLRLTICEDSKIKALRARLDSDAATEVATIADILLSMLGRVPATIVAVIVVKRGLHRFCGPLP